MALVLLGKDLVLEGSTTKIEDKQVPSTSPPSAASLNLRVSIYLPMVVELPAAMLACARIGAVHSVVFGGFSAESLAGRIVDAQSSVVITADGVMRGGKPVQLKGITDKVGRENFLTEGKKHTNKKKRVFVEGSDFFLDFVVF